LTKAPMWSTAYAEDVNEDGPGVLDYVIAALLGAGMVALLSLWAFPFPHPSSWADMAFGAGLRPPQHVFPGSARISAWFAYLCLPPAAAMTALSVFARLLAGATVAFAYLLFGDILSLMLRFNRRNPIWENRIRRLILIVGAVLFACSDAVWRMGQSLSSDTFLFFATVLLLWLFFRFICSGRLALFYCCVFLSGMICAESPAGVILALFIGVASFVAVRRLGDLNLPFFDPLVMQFSKWRTSFFLMQGFALAATFNLASFFVLDGWSASGWNVADMIIKSVVHYGLVAIGSASILGWLLLIVFAMLPLVVSVLLFAGATDEDNFLPYRSGIAFVVVGIMAFSQLALLRPLWFWTWAERGELVGSVYLRGICAFASSLTMVLALTVLGVAVYVRNNHRIMRQRFPEFLESAAEAARVAAQRRAVRVVRRFGAILVTVLLVAAVLPGRRQAVMREMLGIVRDFVNETVREAGDSQWLFTDGWFDSAVELMAMAEGRSLKAVSMRLGHDGYDKFIRTRGMAATDPSTEEKRRVLENGTMDALRTWICDSPVGSVKFATQIGFEFWKKANASPPPPAGVLLRPGMSAEEANAGSAAAHALAGRLLALHGRGLGHMFADSALVNLADAAQWRIAWLVRMRANALDRAGRPKEANEEMKFSQDLDRSNASLNRLVETINRKARESGPQLTPREGLRLALNRADFALAARYAIPILNSDPADYEANFGMGMNFFMEKQYSRAAEHLRRVVERKPKEAAALNNLALCLMHLGDFDGAETNAVRALGILPSSSEIKETLSIIAKEREAARSGVSPKKDDAK